MRQLFTFADEIVCSLIVILRVSLSWTPVCPHVNAGARARQLNPTQRRGGREDGGNNGELGAGAKLLNFVSAEGTRAPLLEMSFVWSM
jgi:hypothetical protein